MTDSDRYRQYRAVGGASRLEPRLLTGVYGTFEPERVIRETRAGFWGLELGMLRSLSQAHAAVEFAKAQGLGLGIHAPLYASPKGSQPEGGFPHPFITSPDADIRQHAFAIVDNELRQARDLGASYVIIHYPKPAVLDPIIDWSDWRFVQPDEYVWEGSCPYILDRGSNEAVFSRLVELSAMSGVQLVLEHDIMHPWHWELLPELFASHSSLGFCLDTGRLHLQQHADARFDSMEFILRMLPYTTNIHLWTVKLGTNKLGGHHPVLPSLSPADGWADIQSMLHLLSSAGSVYVLFEHRADAVSNAELDECYRWTKKLLGEQR